MERSVMALSGVERARVHVTFPKDSIFTDNREPAKASVLVSLRPGVRLTPANVQAICQLAASAVEGLTPDSVSVLDMRGNLLSHPRAPVSPDGSSASPVMIEYRQAVEKDLSQKIAATLDPLVGEGKFRTGISADCDLTSGEESEETFDPSKSVMTSSTKTEDANGTALASGVPGTASNLPRPPARAAAGRGGSSRRSETIAYQTSRLVRHTRLPQGALKRLSVSVLVDYDVRWEGAGAKARRVISPPSPDRLKSIHDLVAAAIGFNAPRGDQLVIESLPFEATLNPEPLPQLQEAPPPSGIDALLRNRTYLYIAGGAAGLLILLAVGAVIAMRKRSGKARPAQVQAQIAGAVEASAPVLPSAGADMTTQLHARFAEQKALREKQMQEAMESLKLPRVNTKKTEALSRHIADEAKNDPAVMAHVLRT
ncbi:MAG: flagellar basal-body MS-ring/collar protein FliF, partial [Bryobacteraceae bacterium]